MRTLDHIEKYRQRDAELLLYGTNGDRHNGVFKVFVGGKGFLVIARRRRLGSRVRVSGKPIS